MISFDALYSDHTSGSTSLLFQFQDALIEKLSVNSDNWKVDLSQELSNASAHWKQFLVIQHFISELAPGIDSANSQGNIKTWIENYRNSWENQEEKWVATLSMIAGNVDKITTHSNSNSVKQTLRSWKNSGEKFKIYQTLSGPVNEGVEQAKWLSEVKIPVMLVPDAMASWCIRNSDMVLLGTDGVYPDGFQNKMGSLAMCMAAKEFNKPVYVLFDGRKILETAPEPENPKPAEEVLKIPPTGIEIRNYYFESVPHSFVSGYISVNGLILPENLQYPE